MIADCCKRYLLSLLYFPIIVGIKGTQYRAYYIRDKHLYVVPGRPVPAFYLPPYRYGQNPIHNHDYKSFIGKVRQSKRPTMIGFNQNREIGLVQDVARSLAIAFSNGKYLHMLADGRYYLSEQSSFSTFPITDCHQEI
jgi:hypothetical protein